MGGSGSTRWGSHTKKRTAEECLVLDVNSLVKHHIGRENMIQPFWCSGNVGQRFYFEFINLEGDGPALILESSLNASSDAQQITFISTPGTRGGLRWWFRCPRCKRRVAKLYVPADGISFACRLCHALTYTSAQTAHEYDRRKDEVGTMGQSLALIKKAEKAQARTNGYQCFCKGKVKAFFEYLRISQEIERLLTT